MRKELEALKGTLYDFISNNGWRYDKDELITIIKELAFATYESVGEKKYIEIEKRMIENLDEQGWFDED